jgi:hypothetical protein
MVTLIAVYTNNGCLGRCDARCYNAKGPDCDCICGGKNHGRGLERAIENTRDHVADEVKRMEMDGVAVAVNQEALTDLFQEAEQ